jgi:hypothetical protein
MNDGHAFAVHLLGDAKLVRVKTHLTCHFTMPRPQAFNHLIALSIDEDRRVAKGETMREVRQRLQQGKGHPERIYHAREVAQKTKGARGKPIRPLPEHKQT